MKFFREQENQATYLLMFILLHFQPFMPSVWGAVYLTASALTLAIVATYQIYKKTQGEKRKAISSFDIPLTDMLMLPISRLTAWGPIKWFPKWSTGTSVVMHFLL